MEPSAGAAVTAVRFGDAEWDSTARRLTVRGSPAKIPWRSAECLAILVEAGGEVVSKEELLERIWAGALMEDSNLAHAVAAIRRALDPAPGGGSYIDTVARMGYRLAVPVAAESAPSGSGEAPVPPPARTIPFRRAILVTLLAGLVLAVGAMLLARQERRMRADALVREGFLHLRRGNPEEGAKAVPLFGEALSIVPAYAPAHAGLAEAAARYGKGSFTPALDLARRAVESDPDCGECKAILGFVLMSRAWAWEEAGHYLQESISADPRDMQRRLWYGYWLSIQGRLAEAEAEARTAISLDPAHPHGRSLLASVHFLAGRYAEAIAESQAAITLNPSHTAGYQWMEHIGTWVGWTPQQEVDFSEEHRALLLRFGRRAVAEAYLNEVGEGPPKETKRYERALWRMWINDTEGALEELEAAVQSRPYYVMYVAVDPAFKQLYGNVRFQNVLRAVGLIHVHRS